MELFKRRSIHDDLHYWFRRLAKIKPARLLPRQALLFLASLIVSAGVVFWLQASALSQEAIYMAGIFVLAALLWVTEALPLFATALLVMGLEVILLANPGNWAGVGFASGASPDYRIFLAPMADPIIILFLGGFLMAQAAIKEGVDKAMAGVILRLFGGNPQMVMLGLMLVTAVFSMWMSNTATTAMMITLVVPMLGQLPSEDRIRKGLVLSIPFAANIGGMGTPIASPPNAVAVGFLEQSGFSVSFLDWMLIAVPLMVVLLFIGWVLLRVLFPAGSAGFTFAPVKQHVTGRGWFVLGVMGVTILLWLSDAWHGLPTAVVALVPAIAYTASGILNRSDFNQLQWHVLILIAGGIALGLGMQQTGLDQVLIAQVPASGALALAGLVIATVVLSTFMSNTATSNLLLPIGVSLAVAGVGSNSPDPYQVGIGIALAASSAMALPISTPPNAIAYAHGDLDTRDMALAGSIMGGIALLLVVLMGPFVINFWMG